MLREGKDPRRGVKGGKLRAAPNRKRKARPPDARPLHEEHTNRSAIELELLKNQKLVAVLAPRGGQYKLKGES